VKSLRRYKFVGLIVAGKGAEALLGLGHLAARLNGEPGIVFGLLFPDFEAPDAASMALTRPKGSRTAPFRAAAEDGDGKGHQPFTRRPDPSHRAGCNGGRTGPCRAVRFWRSGISTAKGSGQAPSETLGHENAMLTGCRRSGTAPSSAEVEPVWKKRSVCHTNRPEWDPATDRSGSRQRRPGNRLLVRSDRATRRGCR